ncbi:hypothetical protein HPB50_000597 [Hyalomma asiaticum]|uniref:Uncharacterized protein n=1 Tax=Hyalomma asiaticum TaxID=266040 RepID=A0ACB7RI81_HYAAI|nr:hypothetical protein HPB50_000597 [Hyalomma asiaticum]
MKFANGTVSELASWILRHKEAEQYCKTPNHGRGPVSYYQIRVMASTSRQSSDVSILTPQYMEKLQSLCKHHTTSVADIDAIFKGFRRTLDVRRPKSSAAPSTSASAACKASKKRDKKSCGDGGGTAPRYIGFERPCTWEPDQKPCWIMADLDLWNRILARNCVELREVKWGELSLQGYQWPENQPKLVDVFHVTLLIHVLLQQHSGQRTEKRLFCEAITTMMNLSVLTLSGMWFNEDLVPALGSFVEHATALSNLQLQDIEASHTDAGVFLDCLARNRSLESLWIDECLLVVQEGQALAAVVQNHVTLKKIEVNGCLDFTPTALLKAAVQSKSLRSLTLHKCGLEVQDIQDMASALTFNPLYRGCDAPSARTKLQRLTFNNCGPSSVNMDKAFAKLIGGKYIMFHGLLVYLKIFSCGLGDMFAMGAAYKLYFDIRLRELNVESNSFSIGAMRSLIGALESIASALAGRLRWDNPRASDFSNSILAAHTPSVCVRLDKYGDEDVAVFLEAIARNRRIDSALIECVTPDRPAVVKKLADTLTSTRSLRKVLLFIEYLVLAVSLPDADVVKLFRALECNRTVTDLHLHCITFSKRITQALGRFVRSNQSVAFLTIDLQYSDPDADRPVQSRRICLELKEALRQNRFITSLSVQLGPCDQSTEPIIKDCLRRNAALLNQAVRFVRGSMERVDALAFETLQHCGSVRTRLAVLLDVSDELAVEMVAEARARLAFNYFTLAGVVKTKVACHRNRKAKKRKTSLDNVGRALHARISSYLRLTDVVDI